MEMDIPLPGEVPPPSEIEPPDIPMPDDPPESPRKVVEPSTDSTASEPSQDEERPFDPPLPPTGAPREDEEESEDPNRYSPSLPIEEDDLPISDVGGSESLPLPPPPPLPSRSSTSSQAPVLGKTQAKKRLLAFSMTKQGGGAGVSFNLTKKTSINKETAKGFSDDKEETKKKPSKKGTVDKARDTISEIEELKRKEMQLLENMQKQLPHYGLKDALNLPPTLPLQLVVGEVLAKKSKREAERRKGRSRSPSEERRRSKSKKSDKDRERSKSKKKLPDSWSEFKKEGHKLRHFRRFKYEVEKEKLREKKRHRRSSRSRSREKSKKEKSPSKSLGRLNLLETPMVIKKVLVAIDVRGTADVDFPEYLVRYTKSRPSVSYCENPTRATYHLIDRKTMLSTVPRDIEELIVGFLNSIRPKRLRAKANIAEVSEAVKNVIESYDQLGTENEGPLVDKQESTIDCAQEEGSKSQIKDDVLKEEVNNKAQDIESSSTIKENEDAKSDVGCLQESEENNTEGKDISESSLNNNSETDKRDVEKDSGEVSCFQKIEICSKEHRFWYQSEKDWLVLHIPLTEEEDVEIEELDVQPNAVIVSEHFNDIKEEPVTDYKYNKKTNHKLRSRNISQSSTNAITEELEPIIKSAIRSKWDSDYEESEEERKPDEAKGKSVNEKLSEVSKSIDHEKQKELEVQDVSNDNLGVVPMEVEDDDKIEDESQKYIDNKGASPDPLENSKDLLDSNKQDPPDVVEKLASEYEEFMKMLGSEQDCDEEDVSNSNKLNNTSNFENSWEDETSDKENFVQNDSLSINESSHVHNDSRASDKHSDPSDPLDKQEWDEKKIYSNRSMSPSSTISLEYGNFKEVLIKHKILNDTLLTKKKKPKVPGSKINKKLKGKLKKSKKKKKKQTSSESSSSSSSSSSDSSASSSSSSTSDDSSSDSSSSSDSNTSSDSSVDFKKLKKRKLKKLKAKLRRKKKKKYDSSSESSESSEDDEDVKKRKKKKNKQSSKLKKKNTKGKVSKKKKNKKVTDEASESLIDQMILRKLKKKRKISDEEEENEEIPKKKKSKLDLDLVEEAVRHKKKSGKTKKFSKISKEKKKKEDTQKKKVKLKKKGSKDKSKSPEDDDYKKISKSKNKKQKKGEKKEKDIFLDFGESSKALKKLKDDDVKPEGSIQSIKKTGIKMSEEDFDIPNFESKRTFYPEDDVSLCQNDNVPFLGENKRLTEEDFEKDVVPVSYKNQEIDKETKEDCFKLKHIEDGNLSSIQPINKVNCDSTKKKSKKDKKEKKKKKEKGKIKGVLSIEAESDKKKKKKKKDKKVKSSSIGSFGDVINLRTGEEVVLHKKDLSEPKSSILTDKEVFKSDQKSFRESSQEINFENSLKLSPTRLSRTRKATDWSDDSETRGCFLKHNLMDDMNIVGEISHSEIHDEPELRKIDLPDKIPVVGFDSQSGDEYGRHSPNKMGECEKKMEQLDEDFRISKEKRERDSFFESLLKSSENSSLRMSPLISLTDNRESLNKEQIGSTKTNKSEEKKTNVVCAQVISRNKHSLSEDSVVLEKEPFIELDKKEQKFSGVSKEKELQTSLPSLHPNVPKLPQNNYDSERYSPTLDLYPLSPNSNEKVNSDMSLDSNGPEDSNSNRNIPSINMLDIPLPPCGVATQRIHSLPPALLPVPAPVPPPVMPVPPPSFSNILSLPVRPQIANIDSKTVSQPKNTEFKTTVTEIEKKAVKSIFTDPLKIPIKKKLNYGKPAPQLKQMNIFEDDDIEEGDESNLQNTGQSLFDRKLDSINMPKKISVGLGKTSESTKNTVFDQTKDTVESESLETTAVKEQSTQKKYVSNQQNNEEIKQYGNMSKLTSERDCELSFNETTSEEIKVTTKTPEITTLGAFSANIDVENARGAWKDSDDSINVVKQVQHNLEDKLDASSNKESENGTNNIPIKEEIVSDDQANDENIDSSNFDLNLVIKQEPESDVSQAVSSEKMQEESQDTEEAEKNKQLIEEEKKRKECEDNKGPRRRELSNERRERGRRDSSRERDRRRIRSRSRSRDRRRDRYRRDSPDRRSRRRDRSRERSRRSSKDRRRERSPRGRREQSRDCSPRRRDSPADNRNPERREYSRSDVNDKKSLDTPKHSVEKTSKQQSPQRKSVSPPRKKPSPFRSPSPLLKSPLYQKMTSSSQFPFSPSSYQSSPPKNNASPIPRKATSPKRTSMSPQRRHLSPHRRLSSPFKKSASPQRRDYSPQRRPPSPQSPYRSPSPYGRHSSLKLSSPKQRYSSPPRRPQSPWRPPSPPKRHTSPHRRPQSPGKRPSSSLKNVPCLKKSPSPWKPPSPPGLEQKKARQQTVDYSGRNPSPLGFKRSLADSTISDSDLPPIKKITRNAVLSPKRLPLDDRIELELGVKKSPPPPPPPVSNYPGYQSFYQIPVHDGSSLQLQPPPQQHRNPNLVQPPRLDWDASQQLMRQGKSTKVLQVGNILQVVPSEALPVTLSSTPVTPPVPVPIPPVQQPTATPTKLSSGPSQTTTVVQVGNMLQVVPSASTSLSLPPSLPLPLPHSLPLPMVSPSPSPPPATISAPPVTSPLLLPLPVAKKNIKVDDAALRRLEKEKRKKEKELKRQQKIQKQLLRKALLLKDTYPTVSELESQEAKLEAEDTVEEVASIPQVVVTPKVRNPLPPPPEKGILISPGFRERPLKEEKVRKSVSFADGVHPGEGEDPPLAEEHPHSPPPMAKEKHFKKSKKKRKVKVRIIRVEDGDDDDDDDDISPPPPPPGSPPPMFHYPPPPPGFMYVPPQTFTVLQGREGLTPLYQQHQSTTTTTHTTTVQFAPHPPPPPAPLHKSK